MRHNDFQFFEREYGIHLPGTQDYVPAHLAHDMELAMDAQPALVTVSNTGIPAFLTTYIDPKLIEVLTTPNKAAEILGEVKKGDWTTRTAMFSMIESTGQTSAYGDWNNNGSTGVNTQFPQRQSFHYQTITQWGEKQLAMAGKAGIDWAQRLNVASALVLNKFQNNSYFYGIAGLANYGLLNDPSLPAPITPTTKAAGGTTWLVGTPTEVFNDIQKLFGQLVKQTFGLIDQNTKLVLVTSPDVAVALNNTNSFNVSVMDALKKNYPNIRFESAPQYTTQAGNLVQLIAEELDGQEAGYCGFTEKMRAHAIVTDLSAWKQKKSQGTWGTIIFMPLAFAQMLGV